MALDNTSLVKTINNIDIYKVLSDKNFNNSSVLCVDKDSTIGISFKKIDDLIDFGNLVPTEGLIKLSTDINDLDVISAGAYLFLMEEDNFTIYKKETFGNVKVFDYNSLFDNKVLYGNDSPVNLGILPNGNNKIFIRDNGEVWFSDTSWNLISDKKTKFLIVDNGTNLSTLGSLFNGDIILNKDTKKISVYANGNFIEQLSLMSVDLISNQSIDGVKSFIKSPIVPNASNVNEVVNLGQLNIVEVKVDNHMSNTSNPHNITPDQIGTYTQIEIDTLLSDKANFSHNHNISNINNLQTTLDGKASSIHNHSINEVNGLQTELNSIDSRIDGIDVELVTINSSLSNKTDLGHTHTVGNISGLQTELTSINGRLDTNDVNIVNINNSLDNKTNLGHLHNINDVNGLQSTLDNKTELGHLHTMSNVSGLQTSLNNITGRLDTNDLDIISINNSLDNKASLVHNHNITDVNGLQTSLDGKALSIHTHEISSVNNLQTTLDNKSEVGHLHNIGNITGLQASLDNKTEIGHLHEISDVNNLQATIDLKSDLGHNHTISNITGLQTSLDGKALSVHVHSSDEVFYPSTSNTVTQKIDGLQVQVDSINTSINNAVSLEDIGGLTWDMTGFLERDTSTLSFNPLTRTFTISPTGISFNVYFRGKEIIISSPLSLVIDNNNGGRYIKLNPDTLQLEDMGSVQDIRGSLLVSYIYWNVAEQKAIIFGDERHSAHRDTQWHYSEHRNRGAVWRSGGSISYVLDEVNSINIGLTSPVQVADEDLEHSVINSSSNLPYCQVIEGSAELSVLYLDGTTYNETSPSTIPYMVSQTTRGFYNKITNGVGELFEADDFQYIVYWLVATNDTVNPIKLLLGTNSYYDINLARLESFDNYDLPMAEFVGMYKIIVQNASFYGNSVNTVISEVTVMTSNKTTASNIYSATDHTGLSGRDKIDQHPITAIVGLQVELLGKASIYHNHDGFYEPKINNKTAGFWKIGPDGSSYSFDNTTYLPSSSYTASDVLTKIKTVDGTGSGLDADLLDGLDSTAFATSSHNHSGVYEPANINIQDHIGNLSLHLSAVEKADLTDGGGSTLHYHVLDRSRSNHTGTQLSSTISDFSESVDDRVSTLIQNGTGITWTYDDVNNTLTANNSITQYTDENAQDSVGNILTDTTSINLTYDDVSNIIKADAIFGTTTGTIAEGNHNHSSSYQPLDADLTSIAGLAGTSGLLKKTAANTWTLDTNTYLISNQSISISGDISGSGATAITLTLPNIVVAGTGTKITYNAKGQITSSTTLSSVDIPDLSATYQPKNTNLTSVSGLSTITTGLIKLTNGVASLDTTTYLATSSYTASDVLTKIKTVDGTGSGLDADLLDGLDSTAFATSTHNHSGVYEPANSNIQIHVTDTTFHLNSTQKTDLTDGGDSTLHYHSADRNRTNHTGTQLSSTISDFSESVDDRVSTLIQNGTNITWTYDDVNNTLTANVSATTTTPGGSTGQLQYNNGGVFDGATNVGINNGDLIIADNASPIVPPDNFVKIFSKKIAHRSFAAIIDTHSIDVALQPALFRDSISSWRANGGVATAPNTIGFGTFAAQGTYTARAISVTNIHSRCKRLGVVSSNAAGSLAGNYLGVAEVTTGAGTGIGGFFAVFRFAYSDAATNNVARSFVGYSSQTSAATNVQPNTLLNCVGMAQLSTDSTQLYIVYGGSTAQAAIPLGTNFPPMTAAGITNGVLYDLSIYSPPNTNGVIHYRVERIGTAFIAEGTLTPTTPGVQTPLSTTLLAPRLWRTNNTSTGAVGIDIVNVYQETDF